MSKSSIRLVSVLSVSLLAAGGSALAEAPERADTIRFIDADGRTVGLLPAFQAWGNGHDWMPFVTFEIEDRLVMLQVTTSGFRGGDLYFDSYDCSGTAWTQQWSHPTQLFSHPLVNAPGMTLYYGAASPLIDIFDYSSYQTSDGACHRPPGGSDHVSFVRPAVADIDMADYFRPPFRAVAGCSADCLPEAKAQRLPEAP